MYSGEYNPKTPHWRVPLLHGLFKDPLISLKAIFAPCLIHHENRERMGLNTTSAGRMFWIISFCTPPFLIILFHFVGIENRGWHYFAWTIYVAFAVIGVYQRMKIREVSCISIFAKKLQKSKLSIYFQMQIFQKNYDFNFV